LQEYAPQEPSADSEAARIGAAIEAPAEETLVAKETPVKEAAPQKKAAPAGKKTAQKINSPSTKQTIATNKEKDDKKAK